MYVFKNLSISGVRICKNIMTLWIICNNYPQMKFTIRQMLKPWKHNRILLISRLLSQTYAYSNMLKYDNWDIKKIMNNL